MARAFLADGGEYSQGLPLRQREYGWGHPHGRRGVWLELATPRRACPRGGGAALVHGRGGLTLGEGGWQSLRAWGGRLPFVGSTPVPHDPVAARTCRQAANRRPSTRPPAGPTACDPLATTRSTPSRGPGLVQAGSGFTPHRPRHAWFHGTSGTAIKSPLVNAGRDTRVAGVGLGAGGMGMGRGAWGGGPGAWDLAWGMGCGVWDRGRGA